MVVIKNVLNIVALLGFFGNASLCALNIHDAVRDNDLDHVKKLVKSKSSSVNLKDEKGNTPLMYAARDNRLEIARYLVEKRALINDVNALEMSALMLAAEKGHIKMVEFLIEKGAYLDEKDENGKRAWMHAKENGHQDIVDLFRRKGAAMHVDTEEKVVLAKEKLTKTKRRGEKKLELNKMKHSVP